MKPKLAIFDFDGTLVDSEPNYALCSDQLFAELGIKLTKDQRARFVGISTQDFSQALVRDFGVSMTIAELAALNDKIYMELARQNTPIFEPMFDLLKRFHQLGVVSAVASGSSLVVLEEIIDSCGFRPYLKAVFSAEQVKNGKPAPDIFLHTAHHLGFTPEECVVFEDSMPGVFAGHQANMRVIAVPPEEEFAHPVFQGAWLTYPGPQHLSVRSVLAAMQLPYIES